MPKKLYTNIKSLCGITEKGTLYKRGLEMQNFKCIENAWLLVDESGLIEDFGTMENCPDFSEKAMDCSGKLMLPAFIDSHTHLIHSHYREDEFVSRIKGLSYAEIAERGGGILNSAHKLNNSSEDELFKSAYQRLLRAIESGTGAIEIKSGYGLSTEGELKMLRVAQRLKQVSPIPIKVTFLGAHAFPEKYKNNKPAYIQEIIEEMLPVIGKEKLADYIDVFCETNYFSVDEMEILLDAGSQYGLKPKVHVNQFTSIGAVKSAVERKAVSVDHLEILTDEDFESLKNSETIPVALPACSFFLKIPFTPVRKLLDKNLGFALATDYNPGSSPCLSMPFVISLACIDMRLWPEEAFNAATLNAAAAIGISDQLGSIEKGKMAHLILTKPVPSFEYLPYSFAENWIEGVFLG